MASNHLDNAFAQEKEKQHKLYDNTISLISNILTNVMPGFQRAGLQSDEALSIYESLTINQGIVESLKTSLGRKKMKVPIFGPTSSGKSMVINAMLGKELLVCGMGHTTNCFLMIEQAAGDDSRRDVSPLTGDRRRIPSYTESESHFIIKRSSVVQNTTATSPIKVDEKYSLDTQVLQDLSDATADNPLDISFRIEVFLGEYDHKCPLLSHYLQIVDCPGISLCRDLGDHVKAFCGDADVHVLIVNSESGITSQAEEHFLKVKERIPNPDIIIGFTQWDRSANERPERRARVKQKHLNAAFELLQSTGTVSNMDQVKERCFFISGKEALDDALGEQVKHVQGQAERKQNFHDFVRMIEERASEAGKKAKLDTNRQACQHVLQSCIHNSDKLKAWISAKMNELIREDGNIREKQKKLTAKIEEYNMKNTKLRERAPIDVGEQLMENTDFVFERVRHSAAEMTKNTKTFDRDAYHEHGLTIVIKWHARVIKACQRSTRDVCEDYSRDLLCVYKSCFWEFPHEHPKAFIEALHEELLPKVSTSSEVPKEVVDSFLKGVTDKGLIAMFATTRRRENGADAHTSRRMAAGASILFTRIRRWLMEEADKALLQKFDEQRKSGLNDDITESCRNTVREFCDITDAYYTNQLDNAVKLQYKRELADRKDRLTELYKLAQILNGYRQEAQEILRRCDLDGTLEGCDRYLTID